MASAAPDARHHRDPAELAKFAALGPGLVGHRPGRWRRCTSSIRCGSPTSATRPAPVSGATRARGSAAGRAASARHRLRRRAAGRAAGAPRRRRHRRSTRSRPTSRPRGGMPPRSGWRSPTSPSRSRRSARSGRQFDLVVASEVVEHVADVPEFLAAIAAVTRPGGLVVLSTLSRTRTSFVKAIIGAEYVLGWLPRGTHEWRRFLTPAELGRELRAVGLRPLDVRGIGYDAAQRRVSAHPGPERELPAGGHARLSVRCDSRSSVVRPGQLSSLGTRAAVGPRCPPRAAPCASSSCRLAEDLAFLGLAVVDAPRLLGEALADILEVRLDMLAHLAQDRQHGRGLGLRRGLGRYRQRVREPRAPAATAGAVADRTTAGAIMALRTRCRRNRAGDAAPRRPAGRTRRRRGTSPRTHGRWRSAARI